MSDYHVGELYAKETVPDFIDMLKQIGYKRIPHTYGRDVVVLESVRDGITIELFHHANDIQNRYMEINLIFKVNINGKIKNMDNLHVTGAVRQLLSISVEAIDYNPKKNETLCDFILSYMFEKNRISSMMVHEAWNTIRNNALEMIDKVISKYF